MGTHLTQHDIEAIYAPKFDTIESTTWLNTPHLHHRKKALPIYSQ